MEKNNSLASFARGCSLAGLRKLGTRQAVDIRISFLLFFCSLKVRAEPPPPKRRRAKIKKRESTPRNSSCVQK